jgi:putative phosphonate metabolism protein
MNEPSTRVALPSVHRYAAYFAPTVHSPWWQAGSSWLGRCAARGNSLPQSQVPGLSLADQQRLTAAPRRYGWHATLKAPFALAPGADLHDLRACVRSVCKGRQPFDMPMLKVTLLGDFLALVPDGDSRAIDEVACACVAGLHAMAAPPPLEEFHRRRAAGLAPEEDALLVRWGYPYVMERFRFHMSLTGTLEAVEPGAIRLLQEAASLWFARLPPLSFESVTLFAEPSPGADFVVVEQFRFAD